MKILNIVEFAKVYGHKKNVLYEFSSSIQPEYNENVPVIFHNCYDNINICLHPACIEFHSGENGENSICFYGVQEIYASNQRIEIVCNYNNSLTKYILKVKKSKEEIKI